jgi:hypothetical protein
MFISVRRYTFGSGSVEEIAKLVQEEFVPLVSRINGFRAYHLIDAGGNSLATINVFDDRAGGEESDRRAAAWAGERLAAFQLSPAEITEGEVVVEG